MIFTYVEPRGNGPRKIPCQAVQVSYRYLTFNLILNEICHRKLTFLLICHGRIEVLNILKMKSEYYIMIFYGCLNQYSTIFQSYGGDYTNILTDLSQATNFIT